MTLKKVLRHCGILQGTNYRILALGKDTEICETNLSMERCKPLISAQYVRVKSMTFLRKQYLFSLYKQSSLVLSVTLYLQPVVLDSKTKKRCKKTQNHCLKILIIQCLV